MPRNGLSILIAIVVGLSFAGCEDEPSGGPPPQPPRKPGAKKQTKDPKAADKAGDKAGDKASTDGKAAAAGTDAAADKPPGPPRRVPTASQMLGLGRSPDRQADGLPAFINPSPMGESTLFAGNQVQPSGDYASMPVDPIDVSPLERNWGQEGDTDEARRRRLLMSSVAAPAGPSNTQIFGDDSAETDEAPEEGAEKPATGTAGAATDERRFRLVMYRVNKKTGDLETFDRRYASEKGMEAAKRLAAGQGYSEQKPDAAELQKVKSTLAAKEEARAAQAAKAKEESCKFRANWTEKGIQQSRCFPNQAALNAFTAARLKALKKNTPDPKKPATPPANEARPDNSIKPVKIGQ